MSKAIRWQVPFASISGTKYRVDIYDEDDGTWSGITQLMAGETPFVTDEDDSDDFFAPVRAQTGTLQVCTALPNGGRISIDELLPANNIARPLQLLNITDPSTPVIEWQGFLSCEAYDQDYTSIPQIIQLPVISVLEAMASVQLDPTRSSGLQPVYVCLPDILQEIDRQSGMTCFTHLNYSRTDYRIISKYIDMTVMFEQKEYNNENSTTYIVSGLSAKDALERICTYMGWIAREKGTELYLQRIGEEIGMYREAIADFPGIAEEESLTEAGIAATFADKWRGKDHKRTVSQGAKSVEVVAKLERYKLDLMLPAFPYGTTEEFYKEFYWNNDWVYILASLNASAYSNIEFQYFKGTINIPRNVQVYNGTTTLADVLQRMLLGPDWNLDEINIATASSPPYQAVVSSGAFYAKVAYENSQQASHVTSDGLYCVWLPQAWNTPSHYNQDTGYIVNTDVFEDLGPIFKMTNPLYLSFIDGYLKLSASMTHLIYIYTNYEDAGHIVKRTNNWTDKLLLHIKLGDLYWDGSAWTDTPTKIWIDIDGTNFKKNWSSSMPITETDGYLIPIDNLMSGNIEIAIYSPIDALTHGFRFLAETFFSKLDVDYLVSKNSLLSDRSENHYFRLLGTNFRDEISINTDLASTLNNQPSPSLIMNSEIEAITELNYGTDQVPDMRRPEVDLLNRLAEYYQAARHRLSLIVEHPTVAPLPLLRLNGISPDNRKYLPLAESRDWQEETSTLTCFETP